MTYALSWHVEGQSVRITVNNSISIEEFDALGKELLRDYLDASPTPLHVVADARQMFHFPITLHKIKQLSEPWLKHRRLNWFILVGDSNMMVTFIVTTMAQILGVHYCIVSSLEEADQSIHKIDLGLMDAPSARLS